jgi:epoxyqueuosine reductase QueG
MAMIDVGGLELMITEKVSGFGVEFVGFTPDFPNKTFDWARSFILLGAPLILPLLDTCPSIWGHEHEKTVKILLEKAVNRVSALLCSLNCRTEKVDAGLGEIYKAGHKAGLGTIGENGSLLTKKYGPRVMWASAATSVEFKYRGGIDFDLCQRCGHCRRLCPAGADKIGGEACAAYEKKLAQDFKNPCGACLRACPVGEDRRLFESLDFGKYFEEKAALEGESGSAACRAWVHVRSYGSYPHKPAEDSNTNF